MVLSEIIFYLLPDGCSCIVLPWALKGLPYHQSAVDVYTTEQHGASGLAPAPPQRELEETARNGKVSLRH